MSKFCKQCGAELPVGVKFCTKCGAPVEETTTNQKKSFDFSKLGKLGLIIPIVALVVVGLLFAKNLFFGGVGKNEKAIINGVTNTLQEVAKNDVLSITKDAVTNGSIEISIDDDNNILGSISSYLSSYSFSADAGLYFDKDKFAATVNGDFNGTKFKDNILYADTKEIKASVPILFGKKNYGINYKNFEGSKLASLMGMSDFSAEDLTKSYDQDKMMKAIKDLYLTYSKELEKSVKKNLKFKTKDTKIDIADKSEKVTKVSTTITDEKAYKIGLDILNYAKKDKKLKNYINEYAPAIVAGYNAGNSYDKIDEDDVYDKFLNAVDEGIEEIEKELERVNDSDTYEFDLDVGVSKKTKQLVYVAVSQNEREVFNFTIGPDIKDPDGATLVVNGTNYMTYTKEVDKNDITYKIKINDGYNTHTVTTNWNKKDGDLSIKYGDSFKLKGNLKISNNIILKLNNIEAGWTSLEPATTIKVNKKASMPKVSGNYTDIADYAMDELEELGRDIAQTFMSEFNIF